MILFFFILATIGMSHVIVDGSIFNPLKIWLQSAGWLGRKILELVNCYQCSGFWSGSFVGTVLWLCNIHPIPLPCVFVAAFLYGCIGAFVSPFAAVIIMFLQSFNHENPTDHS